MEVEDPERNPHCGEQDPADGVLLDEVADLVQNLGQAVHDVRAGTCYPGKVEYGQ